MQLKDIVAINIPVGMKLFVALVGLFYLHHNISIIADAIGKVGASMDKEKHPAIVINGQDYTLMRDYGHKLVLLDKSDNRTTIIYTSGFNHSRLSNFATVTV